MTFFEYAVLIGQVSVGCALAIGLFRFRALSSEQILLLILISISAVIEITSRILWTYRINNLFLFHVYTLVEFLLLGMIYVRCLNGLVRPVYIKALIVFFLLFALVNTLFFQSLTEFNSNVTFAESLLLIVLSILHFYKLLRDVEYRKLERVPMFWINMSVLTYFSGAFLLFHVANELIAFPEQERAVIWGTHAIFNIIHYLLYGIALLVKPENFSTKGKV